MRRKLVLIFLLTLFFTVTLFAQDGTETTESQNSKITRKIDEFGGVGECDLGARVQNLFIELNDAPNAKGYIIIYHGEDELPSNAESNWMRKLLTDRMRFGKLDLSKVVFIDGGFRRQFATEFFLVPDGAEKPEPTDTIAAPIEPKNKAFLYDEKFLDTDYQNFTSEFVLPTIQEKIAEENRIAEEEARAERANAAESTENQVEEEIVVEEPKTPEEIEAEKFFWLNEKFGERLKKLKDSSGVMIFYADNEYYDIGKMQSRIEEGKQKLVAANEISADKIQVVYGGFREQVQMELWIVPQKAKSPTPTPEERPIEETEN